MTLQEQIKKELGKIELKKAKFAKEQNISHRSMINIFGEGRGMTNTIDRILSKLGFEAEFRIRKKYEKK